MPFTLDGKWIPSAPKQDEPKKPVKVRLVKTGDVILTVILNLRMNEKEMQTLASTVKKKLGVGGSVKNGEVEIQGDKVKQIEKILNEMGIKTV